MASVHMRVSREVSYFQSELLIFFRPSLISPSTFPQSPLPIFRFLRPCSFFRFSTFIYVFIVPLILAHFPPEVTGDIHVKQLQLVQWWSSRKPDFAQIRQVATCYRTMTLLITMTRYHTLSL